MTPAEWLHGVLDAVGSGRAGRMRQCPAHDDATPSLSIRHMPDGGAAVKCFTGCTTTEILHALRLTRKRLRRPMHTAPADFVKMAGLSIEFPPVQHKGGAGTDPAWRFEAAHPYGDKWQLLRFRHPSGAKDFRWETLDDRGAWIPGLRGVPDDGMPLYYEKEIRMAVAAGETVFLVESETSVDAFTGRGIYATTWAGGASSPPVERIAGILAAADVVIVPDNDPAGVACADLLRAALPAARILLPPEGCDARDLLAAGSVTV